MIPAVGCKPRVPPLFCSVVALIGAAGCLGPGTLDQNECASDAVSLVQQNCLGCHALALQGRARRGAPEEYNFDSDADLQRHAEVVFHVVTVSEIMPPFGPLAVCDQQLLDAYLNDLQAGECLPSCSGRVCGDDGCGASCGSCRGMVCNGAGRCIDRK